MHFCWRSCSPMAHLHASSLARVLYTGNSWTGRDGPHMQVAADIAQQQLERSRTATDTAHLSPVVLAVSLELHKLQAAITVDHSGGIGLAPGAELAAFLASKRAVQQEQQQCKMQESSASQYPCFDVATGRYAQRPCAYKVLEFGYLSVQASVRGARRCAQDEGTDHLVPAPVCFTLARLSC
jgi:hypothetical protein